METTATTVPVTARPSAPFLWIGLLLCIGGFFLYGLQFSQGALIVPWYIPIFSTTGVLMVLWALIQKRTILRSAALLVSVFLSGLGWWFVGIHVRLPAYDGPVAAGRPFPQFVSKTADDQPFDQMNLVGPRNTVLLFFRGRW